MFTAGGVGTSINTLKAGDISEPGNVAATSVDAQEFEEAILAFEDEKQEFEEATEQLDEATQKAEEEAEEIEFVEQVEQAPDADAIAVLPPQIAAVVWRCCLAVQVYAATTEDKMLQVDGDMHGDALVLGPSEIGPAADRRIGESVERW